MRRLPAATQEERRLQVIGLRQCGLAYREIAGQVGLSRTGVINICQRFAAEGAKGLVSKPRGRKPDEQRFLGAAQEAEVQDLIRRHTPDELDLPFALWSRTAVRELIARHWGVELAVRTVGKYLARWGFTAQRPIRQAYEQEPAAVRRWLRRGSRPPSPGWNATASRITCICCKGTRSTPGPSGSGGSISAPLSAQKKPVLRAGSWRPVGSSSDAAGRQDEPWHLGDAS